MSSSRNRFELKLEVERRKRDEGEREREKKGPFEKKKGEDKENPLGRVIQQFQGRAYAILVPFRVLEGSHRVLTADVDTWDVPERSQICVTALTPSRTFVRMSFREKVH